MKYLPQTTNNAQQQQQYNTSNGHNNLTSPVDNANQASKSRNLDGYVGFVNLPNQVYRKSVKKGFDFNLMVIGKC